MLKSSKDIQQQVDSRLRELEECSFVQGNQKQKLKSKRGGNVDCIVSKKVAWPHDSILGGTTKQRLSYDQLTWSQWVQGFARNILDEKSQKTREIMLTYLCDLMEDTTDFSWQGAKASHAVLLCEMERGAVTWSDTGRIDRIRRAHAQKHVTTSRFFCRSNDCGNKRPWFCKFFQSGTCSHSKDHETNGRLHRHICAHCLENGRQLNHSEKDCRAKKSSKTSKKLH